MKTFKMKWLALAVSSVVLAACLSDDNTPALSAGDVFVLTSNGQLASFNRTAPSTVRTSVAISGLMSGDTLVGMDFRPRDGQLYALARTSPGDGGRLYTINTTTGVATAGATLIPAATPTANGPYSTLDPAATAFAVDFNPMADALRVISDTGQNLRIFVANATGRTAGETFLDGTTNTSAPTADISGAAYTNSFDGTTSTRLLNIDTANDNLTFQDPPNNGTQVTVAPLGVNATGSAAFDIDARNNRGYALLNVGGAINFYTIAIPDSTTTLPLNPVVNAATLVGTLNVPGVVGMALAPVTAPQVVALDGATAGSQRLLKFGIRTPNTATATNVTGLPAGERLLSIDFRPSNSTVYGLSSAGKIFTIDTDTGAATLAVTLNVANNIVNGLADGKRYQVDFNPQADALRIVSSVGSGTQGENYRIVGANLVAGSTNAGVVATTPPDMPLSAGFSVVNIAYTNSFANPAPAATRLFDIDGANNRLALQSPPNDGTLTAVGTNLGPAFVSYGGFDISGGDNGMRLLAGRTAAPGIFSLFNLDLTAGTAGAATTASGNNEIGSGTSASADLQDLTIKF
ncbi:MAG: DUF4394 domain-containing protein [Burkholderiales bacterium]|jgi:hypothetical protein|uniref:DUF4394 domain-containing protein n=1 Tax=Limnobacter sp. TaxID=2003368 RepID=UPI0039BCD00D|nr:DUF4394 domain-containing protein [Burkholderiales bacterium]